MVITYNRNRHGDHGQKTKHKGKAKGRLEKELHGEDKQLTIDFEDWEADVQ